MPSSNITHQDLMLATERARAVLAARLAVRAEVSRLETKRPVRCGPIRQLRPGIYRDLRRRINPSPASAAPNSISVPGSGVSSGRNTLDDDGPDVVVRG